MNDHQTSRKISSPAASFLDQLRGLPERLAQVKDPVCSAMLLRLGGKFSLLQIAQAANQLFDQFTRSAVSQSGSAVEVLREQLCTIRAQIEKVSSAEQRGELQAAAQDLLNRLDRETDNLRRWIWQMAVLAAATLILTGGLIFATCAANTRPTTQKD